MSNKVDIELHEGEPWLIVFNAHEADGTTVMPLGSGTEVEFRISDKDGMLLTHDTTHGVVITDEAEGEAEISISVAEQANAGIEAGKVFYYEIRVTKDGFASIQNEGILKVKTSLFASPPDPLLLDFRARFPEFTDDDNIVMIYMGDAAKVIDGDPSWPAENRDLAVLYLTAHILLMRKKAYDDYQSSGVGTGEVRIIRVEDRSVVFDTSKSGALSKTGMAQTYYGQQYLAMLRRNPIYYLAM